MYHEYNFILLLQICNIILYSWYNLYRKKNEKFETTLNYLQDNGQLIEQLSEFKYTGSLTSEDGYCEKGNSQQNSNGNKDILGQQKNCSQAN